ncbi:hypothetical protein DCC79_15640, partial [bacterium]
VGGSMRPLLHDGDVVRVVPAPAPRPGDILCAPTPGGLVAHRLVGRAPDGRLVLRGDDTAGCDPPLDPRLVLGRVTAVEAPGGWRSDDPGQRALACATAAVARWQLAVGWPHRPRPRAVQRAGRALGRRVLPPMPADEALLLLALRPHPDPATTARARSLARGPLDWDRLPARALEGQVGPLAWQGLKALARAGDFEVPASTAASLRRQHIAGTLRWREVEGIRDAILARLAEAGIAVLAHKGAALALTVYADPAVRIAADIDLSVRDADRSRAEAAVADIRDALVRANPDRRAPAGHHVELDGTAHHDLEPSLFGGGRWAAGRLDWEGIWERAETVHVGDSDTTQLPLRVPAPTDLVLTLVANGVRRGFSPLRAVVDLAHAIDAVGDRVDWEALAAELARTRLDRRAWLALGLARDWLGADIPAGLLEPPADLRMAAWERWLLWAKRRRPFLRVPTRALWAGSNAAALAVALRMAVAEARR